MQQAFNPFLPSYEYIPDGEPHIFDGRVYLYGSHDRFNGKRFCMNDYVCWSAPVDNLKQWRYEGVIWKISDDPSKKKGMFKQMYAPDVVRGNDGKYYLYYRHAGYDRRGGLRHSFRSIRLSRQSSLPKRQNFGYERRE